MNRIIDFYRLIWRERFECKPRISFGFWNTIYVQSGNKQCFKRVTAYLEKPDSCLFFESSPGKERHHLLEINSCNINSSFSHVFLPYQSGIQIAGRNINNLRYADDTTLMAESEEELKSLLMKVKEEWKIWLKAQHSENEDHGIWSHHTMGNRWGNSGNRVRFYFLGLQNHCRWWLQPWN